MKKDSLVPDQRYQQMLEDGQWCWVEEDGRLVNMDTGEIMGTLEWLIRNIEVGEMSEIIQIRTVACPKCGYKPIPVAKDNTHVVCPVCSAKIEKK